MKLFGLSLFGCQSAKEVQKGSATSGPFEITWSVEESRSGAWYNNGGDPNAKQYTSYFNLNYNGKPVVIPGSEGQQENFWQALFLKDAPQPALIVAIHSVYLVTEENGAIKVTPLHEQDGDFATYQFLDSDQGQPGEMRHVTLGDDSAADRFLSGGRYLMVNSRVVLDVQTLNIYPFDLITYEVLQKLDGYHAGNSFIAQFSPGKTQMVLIGNRSNPENMMLYQYGLVVIDFKKNTAYAVPYDRTDTRFFSIWDADQKWMNTYFEWTVDDQGEELIKLREYKQLPYWQGRWSYSEETGEATDYKLQPIEDNMLPVFLDFIRKEVKVVKESREEVDSYSTPAEEPKVSKLVTVMVETEQGDLQVYLNPLEQSINVGSSNHALVQQIGKKFDEEMAKGKYQEYYGRYE